jgi:membrane fusion protein (multidrug efflux system)
MGRGRSWARWLIPVVLVVVSAGLVGLVALLPAGVDPPPAPDIPRVNVEVQVVRAIPELTDTFVLSAVVEPSCVVRVAAEVSGRIERLGQRRREVVWRDRVIPEGRPIDEGEPIAEGDPLVYLNTELLQARFDQAQAQFEYDEREYRRISDLYERGVTSKTELDNARSRLDLGKALLDEAAHNLERAAIVAPVTGILNRLPMEIGEYVMPGDPVAEIVSIDQVKVAVEVPERDVHYLRVGDRAAVVVAWPQETEFVGTITYISELADDQTRTTRVEILVDNRQHALRSGQIVRARLTRRMLTDVIMVPLGSVIPLERGRVVYVVNDNHAERREVELGIIKGRSVQVLSGLSTGERLIVAGHRLVGPGQPVAIVQER